MSYYHQQKQLAHENLLDELQQQWRIYLLSAAILSYFVMNYYHTAVIKRITVEIVLRDKAPQSLHWIACCSQTETTSTTTLPPQQWFPNLLIYFVSLACTVKILLLQTDCSSCCLNNLLAYWNTPASQLIQETDISSWPHACNSQEISPTTNGACPHQAT